MRALTVAPGIANSAQLEDVPEPPASDGAVLVRTLALGVCGTDREIVVRRLRLGAAGPEALGDRPRVARQGRGGAGGLRLQARRSRRRHRAPARSGAVSVLRGRRMGYVPQRPLHRARHQGAQRLRLGFFPHRAGIPDQARSVARHERRPGRADQRRRQGLGSHRAHRPPLARLGAEDAAGHRRRSDRSSCRDDRRAARARRPRARSSRKSARRKRSCASSAAPFISAASPTSMAQAGYSDGMHRRAERRARRVRPHRVRRHRLPGRRLRARPRSRRRYRRAQSHHGARQRHRVRQRQCQPQAL